MLTNYIDAAFFWAEKNPDQAKVLLLFYYLCTLDEEYLQMHDSVKRKGQKRIYYILQELQGRKFNKENAIQLSSLIQNIISSNIKDSFTTHSLDLKFGKKQTKQIIKSLISNQGKV